MILDLRDVTYRYPGTGRDALSGVSLALGAGEFVAVLGPNGSGKTTLLRVALGAAQPVTGEARVGGRLAHVWDPQELARTVGVVSQREESAFPLRVREAVLLGRYPYLSPWAPARAADHAAVARALHACDAQDRLPVENPGRVCAMLATARDPMVFSGRDLRGPEFYADHAQVDFETRGAG